MMLRSSRWYKSEFLWGIVFFLVMAGVLFRPIPATA